MNCYEIFKNGVVLKQQSTFALVLLKTATIINSVTICLRFSNLRLLKVISGTGKISIAHKLYTKLHFKIYELSRLGVIHFLCVTFINLCPSETMTLQLEHHKLLNIRMNTASTDMFSFVLSYMWLCCYRGMTLFVKLIGVLLILFIVKHWRFLCSAAKHLLRPRPGWPQAPLLDKRSAIIAHFKDASPSRTAFMHLFWQTPIHSLLFLASSPFHFPPLFCPSSSFPTNPQACLDERLSRETSANRVWFGSRSYWHTEHRNISLFSFSPHLNLAVVDVGKDEGKCGSGVPTQGSFSAGQKGPSAVPSHPHLLQLILK